KKDGFSSEKKSYEKKAGFDKKPAFERKEGFTAKPAFEKKERFDGADKPRTAGKFADDKPARKPRVAKSDDKPAYKDRATKAPAKPSQDQSGLKFERAARKRAATGESPRSKIGLRK